MRRTLIVLLTMGAPLVASCRAPARHEAPPPSRSAPAAVPPTTSAPSDIIYVEFRARGTIWRLPLDGTDGQEIVSASSDAMFGVLSGPEVVLYQTVTDDRPDLATHDVEADPHLRLYDADGTPVADIEHADLAVLSPDARQLAWITPDDLRTCGDAACPGHTAGLTVAASADPGDRRRVTTIGPTDSIRWLSDLTLLVTGSESGATVVDTRSGATTSVDIEGTVRAVDADAERLLVVDDDVVRVLDAGGGGLGARTFSGWNISASWSDRARVVIVQLGRPTPDLTLETRLFALDAATGRSRTFGSERADGEVVWTPDGAWFAYRRTTADGHGFEMIICSSATLRCGEPVMSWTEGRDVLALLPTTKE